MSLKIKLSLLVLLIIGITIPIVVYSLQQKQIIQNNAATQALPTTIPTEIPIVTENQTIPSASPQASVSFMDMSNQPLTQLVVKPNESTTIVVTVQTTLPLNGFDITIASDPSVQIVKITEGKDAQKFSTLLFNDTVNNRFAKVNTDPKAQISGNVELARVTLKTISRGTGTIKLSSATFTSLQSTKALFTQLPTLAYTIQ